MAGQMIVFPANSAAAEMRPGTATPNGIGYYDLTYKQVCVVAPNASRMDVFVFIGGKP